MEQVGIFSDTYAMEPDGSVSHGEGKFRMHELAVNTSATERVGLTLLELLLVLVLLAVIFGFAMPRLTSMAMRNALKGSASQVRTTMVKARQAAMRMGQPAVFLYREESGFYAWTIIEPLDGGDPRLLTLQTLLPQLDDENPPRNLVQSGSDPIARSIRRLPRDVRFVSCNSNPSRAGTLSPSQGATNGSLVGSGNLDIGEMLFYPDGTSSGGIVMLANAENERLAISVRGLTGVASVRENDDEPRLPGTEVVSP